MSKRDVAIVGTVLAGAAAGVLLAAGEARRRKHLAAPPHLLRLAPASGYARSTALVSVTPRLAPAAPVIMPSGTVTYETFAPRRVGRRVPRGIIGSIALVGLALLGFVFARPHITALAAPTDAYPGTTAVISYASSGLGSLNYDVDAAVKSAATALAAREGTIALPISPQDADRPVFVVLHVAGPFGSDVRVARINVRERPRQVVRIVRSTPVRIDALSLASTAVAAGDDIVARYRSNATAGTVALLDARGGLWQREPLSAGGETRLRAPVVVHDTPFIVVLHAQRDHESIEASAGIVVSLKASSPVPHVVEAVAGGRIVAQSGALWRTDVKQGWTDTVIVLMRGDGTELVRLMPRTAGPADLRLPVVSAPHPYLVSVSHRSGLSGRETRIQPIQVVPARP